MQILKVGVAYFAIIFGAGFILGIICTLWIVPEIGARTAELIETTIMVVVITVTARWIVRRLGVPPTPAARLSVGFIALGLLLVTELRFVLWLRNLTIREYMATRDPITGAAYIGALAVFTTMPLFVSRR